jgi:hypothetical protein
LVLQLFLRTTFPLFTLITLGYLSRYRGALQKGDERIFSAYLYWFALPAIFILDISEIGFSSELISFMAAGIIPLAITFTLLLLIYALGQISQNVFYLLIVTSFFGSLGFFGIPYVTFAYPGGEVERLTILAVAAISIPAISVSIMVLELYQIKEKDVISIALTVLKQLSRNPLILSIIIGFILSFANITLPDPIKQVLRLLGNTTSPLALFMLGVFLYGRTYARMGEAAQLSLLRIILMPVLTIILSFLLNLPDLQLNILVLLNGTPLAISMIVLSERYEFFKEIIASTILITSLGAGIYLNLWILLLDII